MLGKFYLFRPSSLVLLLWLLLALAVGAAMLGSRTWILRASLLAADWPGLSVYPRGPVGAGDRQRMKRLNTRNRRYSKT